jgi:hypothetical protein
MMRRFLIACAFAGALFAPVTARAAEICGNGIDDDSNGRADEGCHAMQCESPLSCADTGMVSPLRGSLRYQLPPDVAPKVPFGPGIGLRRFYASHYQPGPPAPAFQAAGTKAEGTTSATPSWPAHQAGDVALLIVETTGNQLPSLSSAQGFVAVAGSPQSTGASNGTTLAVYWKRAASASEAAPTVSSSNHVLAQIITFRDVAPTGNPWDVTAGDALGSQSSSFSIPGATTTAPNALVVGVLATSDVATASGWTNAGLTDLTARASVTTTTGNGGGLHVATGIKATAGAIGATTGSLDAANRQARMSIALRAAGAPAPAWMQPLGDRWHHTYMAWLTKTGTAPSSTIVLHHQGRDVLAAYASSSGGWDTYTPQDGFRVKTLRQRQASPNEFQLVTLTGETFVYNSAGRLTEIWDGLGGTYTHKVVVAYDGAGQVSTVTDASDKRRLLFGYTGGVLTSVQFQILGGSWTTYHTTSYGYAGGALSTVTIGGALAQTNSYAGGYLAQIQDAAGKSIASFAYTESPGQVARIDTTQGMIGFEYASSRAACMGKTVLHFNRGNALSCSTDGDCGSGFLCGGKTASGATGVCFRAARCLTVASPSDDVITTVAPLGPPSESCTGACATVAQYLWNGPGSLDNYGTQDAAGNYTTRTFDANGMVTQVTFGDPDSNPSNGNGSRTEWRYYGDANYPGKVTEIRRRSDLSTAAASCSASNVDGCLRTVYTYRQPGTPGEGRVATITQTGYFDLDSSGNPLSHYVSLPTTTNSYDTEGRVTQVDGPLSGSSDLTLFEYHDTPGTFADDFLSRIRRSKAASSYLDQQATLYDFWGNPSTLVDADGTLTCLTFSSARGTLSQRREAMAGQSTCTAGTGDLVTAWDRDTALRLVKLTRADGSCLFFEYDAKGHLERTKRRDDCNAGSAGDKQEFVYDAEGLVTEVQTYDASNVLTARQQFTYFDSRRLEKVLNPVNPSTWTGVQYDARGLVSQVDAAGNLGKTVFQRTGTAGAEGRVTAVDKYKTSTLFDTWSLVYSWLGEQTAVTDGDSKVTQTVRDDLGRVVKLVSPDMDYPVIHRFDSGSRRYQAQERFGAGADQRNHSFTFDLLGRPLTDDYAVGHSAGTCGRPTNPPEIERVYDAPPVTCPIDSGTGCTLTQGRLAYVRVRLACATGVGLDDSIDQETFYGYDAAGRRTVEYIRDDLGRVDVQKFLWTPNGELAEVTTPSTATINWSYGSGSSNSDTDRVTAISRNGVGNPVVSSVSWYPYGPLAQYNQLNTYGGTALRTRLTRNLAYRPDKYFLETQTGGTILHQLTVTEDAKGRVTGRDFTSTVAGVRDSFFLYDHQDRVVCETTNVVSTCPTSGGTLKNNHSASPPFTNAGDWKRLLRPIPGRTGLVHEFNPLGYWDAHRIISVSQSDAVPNLGTQTFSYFVDGDRSQAHLTGQSGGPSHWYTYDNRHNLTQVLGYLWNPSASAWQLYSLSSAFDAKGKRVWKMLQNTVTGTTALTYFYYDPLGRLTEVRHTPDGASPSTYSLFQMIWLGDRLTAYWQTDYPSVTTSKRYVVTDETNRPVEMWSWPTSNNAAAVWGIDPSAWGFDTQLLGANIFQPVLFAGQYKDTETTAFLNDTVSVHRPGLLLDKARTYDAFAGSYLQVSPGAPAYGYAGAFTAGVIDFDSTSSITHITLDRSSSTIAAQSLGIPDLVDLVTNMPLSMKGLPDQNNQDLELGEVLIWYNAWVLFPGFFYEDFSTNPADSDTVSTVPVSAPSTGDFIGAVDTRNIPYVLDGGRTPADSPLYAPVKALVTCEDNCGNEPPVLCRAVVHGKPWRISGPPTIPNHGKTWKTCASVGGDFDPSDLIPPGPTGPPA